MVLVTRRSCAAQRRMARAAFILPLALVALACSTEAAEHEEDALSAIHRSCHELAASECSSRALCGKATFANEYGTLAECTARREKLCVGTWFANGSLATPGDVHACARALDLSNLQTEEHCRRWLEQEVTRNPPAECHLPGTLPLGADCVSDLQCAIGSCRPATSCGQCGGRGTQGDACAADDECEPNLACSSFSCGSYGQSEQACGPGAPCEPGLGCDFGKCRPRRNAGAPCDPGGDSCRLWDDELACNSSGSCTQLDVHGEAEPCGQLDDGTVAQCAHGFTCRASASPKQGECVPLIEDGLKCAPSGTFVFSGPCRAPALCIDGFCLLEAGAACRAAMP
jgi:hypothetical protein